MKQSLESYINELQELAAQGGIERHVNLIEQLKK
jgi:hypothetical protein